MKKGWKVTVTVLALLIVSVLLALLLVSPIAKGYINKHGEEILGRKVQMDKLKVRTLCGSAKIIHLTVFEDDGATPFASIDTIDTKVELLKLLRHELNLKHATISNLDIRVLQDGNHFNFSSIIEHFKAIQDATQPKDAASGDWALGIYNIRLSHWKVDYQDLQRGSHWDLEDMNLTVPGVYFSGERNTDAGLVLEMADGGNLAMNLDYNMQSNDFNLSVGVADFAVSNIKAYLTDAMNVGTMEGKLDGQLHAVGNLSQLLNMTIGGNIQLTSISLSDTKNAEVLALDKLTANVRRINIDSLLFDVDSVAMDGVSTHFDRYAATNNYAQLFSTRPRNSDNAANTAAKEAVNAAAPSVKRQPRLRVRHFSMRGSRVTFNDHTLELPFSLPVSDINIDADGVTLKGANRAHITAGLPQGSQLDVLFRGNMGNIKQNTLLNVSIRRLPLATVSPYSVHYTAYPFTNGTLTFTSENTIVNNIIKGKNSIDIYKPEVGEKQQVDSALHVPLKAALYVLTDKDGKVQLDVPVSGNLDDPKFRYWKAVWKTLGNMLVKVAAVPFNKISEALGINGDDLKFIAVAPMQQELSSEQMSKLEQLAKIAACDSSIVIILAQQINADAEEEILQLGERRNQQIRDYMKQLGVKSDQLMVLTQDNLEGITKIGYKVDAEMRSPEGE